MEKKLWQMGHSLFFLGWWAGFAAGSDEEELAEEIEFVLLLMLWSRPAADEDRLIECMPVPPLAWLMGWIL